MAASSPTPDDNKTGDLVVTTSPINGGTTPQILTVIDRPAQRRRGLNKPKCIKCGNVARSKCPFESCKNCCLKLKIHVLFMDAVNINKWRFSNLKEHIEGNFESESEAFDRYVWNASLLEETFSTEGLVSDGQHEAEPTSSEVKFQKLVTTMKVKLMFTSEEVDNCRKRIRNLVDQQLQKLQERDVTDEDGFPYADEIDTSKGLKRPRKEGDLCADRHTSFSDTIDKLSKAQSRDDFESFLEMERQLLNQSGSQVSNMPNELDSEEHLAPKHESDNTPVPSYSLLNLCTVIQIGEDALSKIDAELLL